VIVVNIARPITQEKLQQLVAHELMHYVQRVVEIKMENKLTNRWEPLFTEGGAEYVDLVFPRETRAAQLLNFFNDGHGQTMTQSEAEHLVAVSASRSEASWSQTVRIAQELHDGTIDRAIAAEEMEHKALLRQDSWPIVRFMEQWGTAYVATYALGKELIKRFVHAVSQCDPSLPSEWTVFAAFTRCVPTPLTVQKRLRDCLFFFDDLERSLYIIIVKSA